tara:strand:+ start:1898 stop:2935 length:1038 start_codon:yes stop_codon:yes gene_type:complete
MSSVLIITDQHFGVRNDNQHYVERYRKFYTEKVLPTIDKEGITEILCLGDTFDRRKGVNFHSLEAAKEMWFRPLQDRGIKMTMLIGNHDIYFKNTLRVNSPELLLGEFDNIEIIYCPGERLIAGEKMMLVPWICDENREATFEAIADTDAKYCMGHLELKGFNPIPGVTMTHGDDASDFSKFDMVCSGHFHCKSQKGNVTYLGNPCQLYWNDFGSDRGFHILNTSTQKLKFYRNPYDTFQKIYYKDDIKLTPHMLKKLEGTYVKLIVEQKEDQVKFDQVCRRLQAVDLADLKIIEDMSYDLADDSGWDAEVEDTLTILEACVAEFENKDKIFGILKSLYMEAQEV